MCARAASSIDLYWIPIKPIWSARLTELYQQQGSWDDIEAIVVRVPYRRRGPEFARAPVTLVDAENVVIYSGMHYQAGQRLAEEDMRKAVPLEVNGATVGRMLFAPMDAPFPPREPPEAAFLQRVNQAILFGALGATVVALLLAIVLARGISRPVRELTVATQAVARGDLGGQVVVRTRDEIGELAASFNKMSADLARSTDLRRQMTADIAHDLRTPLAVIVGYTEALSDGKMAGNTDIYGAMYEEAQHLQHLIDDLRTLSLADAGELRLQRQPYSPRRLLERTAASHQFSAEQQGVSLQVKAGDDLPDIEVDPERMAQVLNNLVSNALRYTPAGGVVILTAETSADAVQLHVHDSGVGIPAEELPQVFERFYKGDAARSRNGGESGLGLAIARSLVEAHGGRISVTSRLGEGTTFTISLPARVAPGDEI